MKLRDKICKGCGSKFMPATSTQRACSLICAIALVEQAKAKKERAERLQEHRTDRVRREKLKTRAQWAKEAQEIVNKYVRLRDAELGCVSCDRPASWKGQWHASHFRSIGAAPGLRYHLWNIHKSCSICNNHLSGNLSSYLPRLIAKIGPEKVEWLKSQNGVKHLDVEYFTRIKRIFTKKARMLKGKL